MTAQGSPATRFRRAVERRSVLMAELAAREMGSLGLHEALSLVCLYAGSGDPKFDAAAVRWLGRFSVERDVKLGTVQLAAVALGELRGQHHEAAAKTLLRLV